MSPQIPTFVSKKELTTEPGAVLVKPEAYGIKGDRGKILQAVGETLTKIGAKFQEIQDVNEYTQAQVTSAKRLNDVWLKAQDDPDIWNTSKTAQDEITKIADEASSKIGNQLVKNKFMATFELDKLSTTNKINDHLRKKQLDDTGAKAMDYISTFEENYYNAGNDVDRQIFKVGIKNKINDLVIAGVWDKTKAQEYWEKEQTELNTGLVKTDIYNDNATQEEDSVILAGLKAGKKGPYPQLTHEERLDLIKESQTRIFANNQKYKRDVKDLQDVGHDKILDDIATGTLTLKDIESAMKIPEEQGGLPKKILVAYQKGLQRGIESDLKKITSEKDSRGKPTDRAKNSKKYLDLIDKFIDDESDLWTAREFLANAYVDGIISSKESKFLNGLRRNLQDIKWNRQSGIIKSTIEWTKNRLKAQSNPSDWEIALRIKQLLDGIQEGKAPQEVANQVISDQLDLDIIKSGREQPQKRIFANNPETNQRVYSDDGGETWYDEKTGELIK